MPVLAQDHLLLLEGQCLVPVLAYGTFSLQMSGRSTIMLTGQCHSERSEESDLDTLPEGATLC